VSSAPKVLTKWSFRLAMRPRGLWPELLEAIVKLRLREWRDVPLVMVSIRPEDCRSQHKQSVNTCKGVSTSPVTRIRIRLSHTGTSARCQILSQT